MPFLAVQFFVMAFNSRLMSAGKRKLAEFPVSGSSWVPTYLPPSSSRSELHTLSTCVRGCARVSGRRDRVIRSIKWERGVAGISTTPRAGREPPFGDPADRAADLRAAAERDAHFVRQYEQLEHTQSTHSGEGGYGGGFRGDGEPGADEEGRGKRSWWKEWRVDRFIAAYLAYAIIRRVVAMRSDERAKESELSEDGVSRIDVGDGRRLVVRDLGKGSPVVVIDAGAVVNAAALQREVARCTRVIAVDHAGVRYSDARRPTEPSGPEAVAKDTAAVLRALEVDDDIVVVGQEVGWAAAAVLAARNVAWCAGLILVDPAPQRVNPMGAAARTSFDDLLEHNERACWRLMAASVLPGWREELDAAALYDVGTRILLNTGLVRHQQATSAADDLDALVSWTDKLDQEMRRRAAKLARRDAARSAHVRNGAKRIPRATHRGVQVARDPLPQLAAARNCRVRVLVTDLLRHGDAPSSTGASYNPVQFYWERRLQTAGLVGAKCETVAIGGNQAAEPRDVARQVIAAVEAARSRGIAAVRG